MIITKERRKEIEEILLKARPYFRKNSSTPGLIINFDSSDEDISKAGKYIAMHLHPDVIAHKEYLTDVQKEELAQFLSKVNAALDDIKKYKKEHEEIQSVDDENVKKDKINIYIKRLNKQPKNQMINYYELFLIDRKLTNEQIISSIHYKTLKESLNINNINLVGPESELIFRKLVSLFEDFNKNVLENKDGRYYYDQLLDNSTKKEEPAKDKKNQETQKENPYKNEIINLLNQYVKMMNDNFIDYYKLFNIDINYSRIQIINSDTVNRLKYLLTEDKTNEYNLSPQQQKTFISLCKTFDLFVKWTLSSDEKKKEYDISLIQYYKSKQPNHNAQNNQNNYNTSNPSDKNKKRKEKVTTEYRYIYSQQSVDTKEVLSLNVKKLYKALEQGIEDWGISVTVLMLNKLFQTKKIDSLEPEMIEKLQPYTSKKDIKNVFEELLEKYPSSNTLELAEKVMDGMLSRKTSILKDAITFTAKKHGPNQSVTAVEMYMKVGNSKFFSKGGTELVGREKIMLEISPNFIKYILVAMDENRLILLDYPEHISDQFNDRNSISEVVTKNINIKQKGFRN